MTKFVLIDAGGLLLNTSHLAKIKQAIVESLRKQSNSKISPSQFYSSFKVFEAQALTADLIKNVVVEFFRYHHISISTFSSDMFLEKYLQGYKTISFYPGITSLLREMTASGVKIIIVSDAIETGEELRCCFRSMLESESLSTNPNLYCANIISSRDIGATKKSGPDFFKKTLRYLDLYPDQVAFIGHHTSEIISAHAAAIRCVCCPQPDDDTNKRELHTFALKHSLEFIEHLVDLRAILMTKTSFYF